MRAVSDYIIEQFSSSKVFSLLLLLSLFHSHWWHLCSEDEDRSAAVRGQAAVSSIFQRARFSGKRICCRLSTTLSCNNFKARKSTSG